MSRIAKETIEVPAGVDVVINGQQVTVKSQKGELKFKVHPKVQAVFENGHLRVEQRDNSREANMQSGTARALLHNLVVGLTKGFERKLHLVGVGYRAQVSGKTLNLNLGYSHPVEYGLPEGASAETPSQTDITLKSADKALLGQVCADLRAYRPPEPYKGKGLRYADEVVHMKEAKKK